MRRQRRAFIRDARDRARKTAKTSEPKRVFLVTFRGPVLEAYDARAGEPSSMSYGVEVEATDEVEARAIGERMAEEAHEGACVTDVELTFEPQGDPL